MDKKIEELKKILRREGNGHVIFYYAYKLGFETESALCHLIKRKNKPDIYRICPESIKKLISDLINIITGFVSAFVSVLVSAFVSVKFNRKWLTMNKLIFYLYRV
ncbi:MAG: hypothetical protein R6V04_10005 [bacterium]